MYFGMNGPTHRCIAATAAMAFAASLVLAAACAREPTSTPATPPRADTPPPPSPAAPPPPVAPRPGLPAAVATLPDVAERCVHGVVNIASTKVVDVDAHPLGPLFHDPFFRRFFGPGAPDESPDRRERSLGSGVLVSADGTVVTNNHVVEHAAEIAVALADGREYAADVVGTDPKSDVAVLRIRGDLKDLRPLSFGDSTRLRLGDLVLAIGNPFGLGHTVTMGIVSAKGRANVGIVDYEDFIQTDAAINPGNSGGALLDLDGNLVGVNTAIVSRSGGYQGVGFAIPSNMARAVMEGLLARGRVVRGWLGVMIQNVDRGLAEALGLASARGVIVSEVMEGSPAHAAGLVRGDVIVRIDGSEATDTGMLRNTVAMRGAGARVRLDVVRDGAEQVIEVALAELPEGSAGRPVAGPGSGGGDGEREGELGGMTIAVIDARLRERLRPSVARGLVVTDVAPDGAAARAGVRPGDVIVEVNRRPVATLAELRGAWDDARERVLLLVQRAGSALFVVLKK
jgi:serine protease Do